MFTNLSIRQIAYYVPDIRQAAKEHSRVFGSGPFYVADQIRFASATYRGEPTEWDHSAAFGQWGDVMIEFTQQNNIGDSVLTDVFPAGSGRTGLHHLGFFVDDPVSYARTMEHEGYSLAFHGVLPNGMEVRMIDARAQYGHMLEIYQPTSALTDIFDFIRDQARTFDGSDPIRSVSFD
jgi:hypothetical protein